MRNYLCSLPAVYVQFTYSLRAVYLQTTCSLPAVYQLLPMPDYEWRLQHAVIIAQLCHEHIALWVWGAVLACFCCFENRHVYLVLELSRPGCST